MKTEFKHTVANAVGTRKSPRVYTHAVVGEVDYGRKAVWTIAGAAYRAKDNFEYYTTINARPEGATYEADGSSPHFKVSAKMKAEAAEYFATHGTELASIVANAEMKAADEVATKRAADEGTAHVLQWSMSAGNASKAVGTWTKRHFKNVRVVEVTRA